jgi:hypothetical protein
MDRQLTLDCFEPEAQLEYSGLFKGTAAEFVEWLWPVHSSMVGHTHRVSNMLVEFRDDSRAVSETMVLVTLRMEKDGELVDLIGHGRYLDGWRKTDTSWRISGRTYVSDLGTVLPVGSRDLSDILYPSADGLREINGTRNETDPSYALFWD